MKTKIVALVVVALVVCGVTIYVNASSDTTSTEISSCSSPESAPMAYGENDGCTKKSTCDKIAEKKSCPKSDSCDKSKSSCPESKSGCPESKSSCPKSKSGCSESK